MKCKTRMIGRCNAECTSYAVATTASSGYIDFEGRIREGVMTELGLSDFKIGRDGCVSIDDIVTCTADTKRIIYSLLKSRACPLNRTCKCCASWLNINSKNDYFI